MIKDKVLYSLDDLMIEPAPISKIKHRKEIQTRYDNGWLPIFTAPMPCVVSLKDGQFLKYMNANIRPIIPRTEPLDKRLAFLKVKKYSQVFVAFSLDEFFDNFLIDEFDIPEKIESIRVLIDIANGNLQDLHDKVLLAKNMYHDKMVIMGGNVASPEAFRMLAKAGCDYIRCSVGSGSGCFHPDTLVTTTNGKKTIKQIKPGDYVLTHTNTFKKVTNLIPQKEDKQLVIINNKLKCTKQHKLFVINKDDKEKVTEDNYLEFAYWLEAEKLDKSKHLLINLVSEPT